MPIGNTNIHIQINVSEFINKLVSLLFCEFKSFNVLKWKQKYYFSTFIISNSQIEILVSFSRSTNVNANMSFPNSNFEGIFSTYVWQVILTLSRAENWMLDIATYIMQKILNFFICVEFRIRVKKWNIYEAHIFTRPLQQKCRLETTSSCLNTRLRVNKKFQNSH